MNMNEKTLAALTSSIYVSRLALAGGTVDTDDKRLRASGLYPDWVPGDHPKGEIVNADGQTWEVFQAYDNAVYPDIRPGEPAWYTFNRPLHGTSPETARPWVKPQHGAADIYHISEYMIWTDGGLYLCIRDTNYSPEEYAADWKQMSGLDDEVNPDDISAAEVQSADQPAAAYSLRFIASAVGRLFRAE